jgi:hypothetical protein
MNLDKERLLEWLKIKFKEQEACRDNLPIEHQYWEFHEGASDYLMVVIKAIEEGSFDLKG